jgi:sulfur-oxidizing protein SoxY
VKRRAFLAAAVATPLAVRGQAVPSGRFQPVQDISPLLQKLTNGVKPEMGGIDVELPQIAENGNSVPLHIKVQETGAVKAIHVIAERNPRPLVASFLLGPAAGRAEVSTRVRLAGTQKLTVLAALGDGRFRMTQRDVLVTSAACLDESL